MKLFFARPWRYLQSAFDSKIAFITLSLSNLSSVFFSPLLITFLILFSSLPYFHQFYLHLGAVFVAFNANINIDIIWIWRFAAQLNGKMKKSTRTPAAKRRWQENSLMSFLLIAQIFVIQYMDKMTESFLFSLNITCRIVSMSTRTHTHTDDIVWFNLRV